MTKTTTRMNGMMTFRSSRHRVPFKIALALQRGYPEDFYDKCQK